MIVLPSKRSDEDSFRGIFYATVVEWCTHAPVENLVYRWNLKFCVYVCQFESDQGYKIFLLKTRKSLDFFKNCVIFIVKTL